MEHNQKPWRIRSVCLLCLGAIVLSCGLLISSMIRMIEDNITNTVSELADHDLRSIEDFLDDSWKMLQGTVQKLEQYQPSSMEKVQNYLQLETEAANFSNLWLIAESGEIYTDTGEMIQTEDTDLLNQIGESAEPVVLKYDLQEQKPSDMLLFAVPVDHLEADGIQAASLAGLISTQNIQNDMHISSFKKDGTERGYASVIDSEGTFIVNADSQHALHQNQNMFVLLEAGTMPQTWNSDEVYTRMKEHQTFHFRFLDENGTDEHLYFQPIEGLPWYFVSMVESSVFTDLTHRFIFSSVSMVGLALIICFTMMFIMMRHRTEALRNTAQAEAKSEFLASMSHKIRTPLSTLIGLLYLIRTHLREQEVSQIASWVRQASDTASFLQSSVGDILETSVIASGKVRLHPHPTLIRPMLESVCSMFQTGVTGTGSGIRTSLDLVCEAVSVDEIRVKQVLVNIISNAVKFSEKGSPIEISVQQKYLSEYQIETVFEITDQGVGMSEAFLEKIWDIFAQEPNQYSQETLGTGLGLPIVKGLVEAMQGSVHVTSSPGAGTTFTVCIPAHSASEEEAAQRLHSLQAYRVIDRQTTVAPRILIAEEDSLNRQVLAQLLSDRGFDVKTAADGQEILDILRSSKPWEYDSILADIHLPKLDGTAVTRTIRKAKRSDLRTIPVFAMSASSFQSDRDEALEAGMDAFISKPVNINDLLDKINIYQQYRYRETDGRTSSDILQVDTADLQKTSADLRSMKRTVLDPADDDVLPMREIPV